MSSAFMERKASSFLKRGCSSGAMQPPAMDRVEVPTCMVVDVQIAWMADPVEMSPAERLGLGRLLTGLKSARQGARCWMRILRREMALCLAQKEWRVWWLTVPYIKLPPCALGEILMFLLPEHLTCPPDMTLSLSTTWIDVLRHVWTKSRNNQEYQVSWKREVLLERLEREQRLAARVRHESSEAMRRNLRLCAQLHVLRARAHGKLMGKHILIPPMWSR